MQGFQILYLHRWKTHIWWWTISIYLFGLFGIIQNKFLNHFKLNLCNANLITCKSEAYHTHNNMVYHNQTLANATWGNLNNIWSLNLNSLSNQLQLKCDKLKLNHINTINIIMCLCIIPYVAHFVCIVCSDRGEAETRDHPLRWRPRYRNLVSEASSPPLWSCR